MTEKRPDMILFSLTLIMVLLGVLMVFNASTFAGRRFHKNPDAFLIRQAIYAVLGIAAMVFFTFFSYRKIQAFTVPIIFFSLFMLIIVLIPGLGKSANNARRWISIGPVQIQPSEFVKLAMVIYLSMIMDKKKLLGLTKTFRGFIPPLLVMVLFFILIFAEPDFSTAAILLFTGLMIFFAGGVPPGHLFGLVLSSAPFIIVLIFSKGYMRSRLFAHIDPLADISHKGYHIIQSLLSFQKGGLFGRGIGKGVQKMGPLPESHTDFILAAHAEETGFFGIFIIMTVLFLLVSRIFRISVTVTDDFARFFTYGIAVLIGWQALINLGVVTGLLPTTGLPFPFLSAGGSSLIAFCIAIGIVLNISRQSAAEGGGVDGLFYYGWRDRRAYFPRAGLI